MFYKLIVLCFLTAANAKISTESYKGQYCTDPRTMKHHEAYSEWADAYSCTRHRCQPGGRSLAIYTVGCKRVEAPESAIECEEVVEDTNMQFPYCCTRLRCLVLIRGEVWTRVLGQPWEKLPAAPWSHMYKMKKPPPKAGVVLDSKTISEPGPVYELAEPDKEYHQKIARMEQRGGASSGDRLDDILPKEQATENRVQGAESKHVEPRSHEKSPKYVKRPHKPRDNTDEVDLVEEETLQDKEQNLFVPFQSTPMPAPAELSSQETYVPNAYPVVSQKKHGNFKTFVKAVDPGFVENKKNTEDPVLEEEKPVKMPLFHASPSDYSPDDQEKKEEKSSNLQSLVDAIGTRMRDIESVVQKMSKNVEKKKTGLELESAEKFQNKDRSKYLRSITDVTTESSMYLGDTYNGYFSDSSNAILRKNYASKDPVRPPTYMAPIADEHHRKATDVQSDEEHKHRKKHMKTIKKLKKHHKTLKVEKRKRFNKLTSMEVDTPTGSNEDNI